MKQYRLPTANPHIYHELTINDDQTMTLYFHGIDSELTFHPTISEDGWIITEGAMFPPVSSGRWTLKVKTETKVAPDVIVPTPLPQEHKHRRVNQTATVIQPATIQLHTEKKTTVKHSTARRKWINGVGITIAASAALVVIYETGLLIPLGLIGLATSGLVK